MSNIQDFKIDQSSLAWKIFNTFLSESQYAVTDPELTSYAINELHIPTEKLRPELMKTLSTILITFMNIWSGWHFKKAYHDGEFGKEIYFRRFQKYMTNKMQTAVKNHFNNSIKIFDGTEDPEPEFAPYHIYIKCPANMLNTIVFCNSGEDIIMKQHLGDPWQMLNPSQLINWPNITVSFRTPDIGIERRQATEVIRYLNFLPQESCRYSEIIIEHTEAFGKQEVYSFDYLDKYIQVYLESLKQVQGLSETTLQEAQIILSQFLEDIRYMNVQNSMATNTLVRFRLTPFSFIRNKKLMKISETDKQSDKDSDETRVGYCEIITPKIELTLVHFKPKQLLDTGLISFEYTERIKQVKENRRYALPQISYKCNFCDVDFTGPHGLQDILKHLQADHKMEQHVRCTICKAQFDVGNLAGCRWRHKCLNPLPAPPECV